MECCGRREVLTGTGAVASAIVLAGCGGDTAESGADEPPTNDSSTDAAQTESPEGSEDASQLASVADVPVGGGVVVQSAQVVLTQPTEGDFRAFSAVCTHQGCLVTEVRDGVIACPCHGSQFDIATGAVVAGPAPSALDEKQVTVNGEGITVS